MSIELEKLFEEEIARGINIFLGGRRTIEYEKLSPEEETAVKRCIRMGATLLEAISPKLANDFLQHESVFLKFAGIAKAHFPESKPIAFPSQVGTIGVNFLIPQAIRYTATPSATLPAYTSYPANSWELSLTAGTPAYFFGDGTNFYKASPQTNMHELIVIMQNGVVEIGTTPSIDQFRIWTQAETKYGIYTVHPLVDQPIEENKLIYRYPTLGVIPIYHDFGIQWGFMPRVTGTADIRLIGLFFYEHDFMPDLTWI